MANDEVQGVVIASGTKVWMYFVVAGSLKRFTGSIDPDVSPFVSETATLSYTTLRSGNKTFTATVGKSTFSFEFSDENLVTGTINPPLGTKFDNCSGSGSWEPLTDS